MIKIFILEDHPIVRIGLRKIIANHNDLHVIGDFDSTNAILDELEKVQPDLILVDISLPDISGLDFIIKVKKIYGKIKMAVLTIYNQEKYILNAIEAGADGYFHKSVTEQDLIEGIRKIHNNQNYYSPDISQVVVNYLLNKNSGNLQNIAQTLSIREKEVLILIAEGYTHREIADKIFISSKTIDNHRANILKKLKLRNNAQLTKFAIEQRLI